MIGIIFWICIYIILYIYLGYPLILTILAGIRPMPSEYAPIQPSVTLIISAYNEENNIAEKLNNTLSLDYPKEKLQILVVADGSDDRTVAITESFGNMGIELIYEPTRRGKMAAINHAILFARHEVVVFSDANNYYQKDTIKELVKPFSDPTIGGVSGSKRIIKGDGVLGSVEGIYWQYEAFIKTQETRLYTCTSVSGEIFAIRRRLFNPPPVSIINDDFFIMLEVIKQGYRVVYALSAYSFERVSPTEGDEIVRRTRIISGRYQAMIMLNPLFLLQKPIILWQIISHKYLRPLLPFTMIGALLTNLLALMYSSSGPISLIHLSKPFNWLFLTLQGLFYLIAWLGNNIKGTSLLIRVLYLPTYLVNSNLAALFGFYKYITGGQTVMWKPAKRYH
jgi:cellulose synthase/poly-beta-1,6-N-acetylglucosamine synthase-like glycosyltransferase